MLPSDQGSTPRRRHDPIFAEVGCSTRPGGECRRQHEAGARPEESPAGDGKIGIGSHCSALPRSRSMVEPAGARRSEEHTSELQSLMRISYAVFCLKKKKKTTALLQYKTR